MSLICLVFHGPYTSLLFLCDHCSLIFGFLCFSLLSLGVALYYIYSFHSSFFFLLKKKKKGREKEAHCVLALFSLFLKTRLVNLCSHDMSIVLFLTLMSLFIALY